MCEREGGMERGRGREGGIEGEMDGREREGGLEVAPSEYCIK